MSSISSGGVSGASDALLALIELVADPNAAKAKIAELRSAETAAREQIAALATRENDVRTMTKDADDKRAAVDRLIAEHNTAVKEFQAQKTAADNTSANIRTEYARRTAQLDRASKEFHQLESDTKADFAARERNLAALEAAAAAKTKDLSDRENLLGRKERAFGAVSNAFKTAMADQ